MPKKIVSIGLALDKISIKDIEEFALQVENKIRTFLQEALSIEKSYDADIIVSVEKKEDCLVVFIDLGILGYLGDVIDYDSIVRSAIREASRYVEQYIQRYRKTNNHG